MFDFILLMSDYVLSHKVMSCFLSCDRAHQGFGWVGEWANSGSVKPISFSEYHLYGQDAISYINVQFFFNLKNSDIAFPILQY